jgi:predicted RND superfamily exporter protein
MGVLVLMLILFVIFIGFGLMKTAFDADTPDQIKDHGKFYRAYGRVGIFIVGLIVLFIAWLLVQMFTSPPFYG